MVEKENMLICKLCSEKQIKIISLFHHIRKVHKMTSKEYYDKFFKIDGIGHCQECGAETTYVGISKGYLKFCSAKCAHANEEVIEKTKKTCLKNLGVEYPMQNKCTKEKYNKNSIIKWGVKKASQLDIIKDKAKKTCFEKYGFEAASQHPETKEKHKKTCFERYGVENSSLDVNIQEKAKKTNLLRYGAVTYTKSKEYREKKEFLGLMIPLDELSEFQKYRKLVESETRKHKKELYKSWDGTDYYTGEKLITTFEFKKLYPNIHPNQNRFCPTIDHKISVFECFSHNILPEVCGKLENLCICSRLINSSKHSKTEVEYIIDCKERKKVA